MGLHGLPMVNTCVQALAAETIKWAVSLEVYA
jgi:hypothetical protein